MSWNLLIYKQGNTPEQTEPLGDLETVADAFSAVFRGLEWLSSTRGVLAVDGGFELDVTVNGAANELGHARVSHQVHPLGIGHFKTAAAARPPNERLRLVSRP